MTRPANTAQGPPEALAARLQKGDPDALTEAFRQLEPQLRRWLAWRFASRLDASDRDDVIGQTVLRAWRLHDRCNPHGNWQAWLRAIARSVAFDLLRARARAPTQSLSHDVVSRPPADLGGDRDALRERLRRCIKELPEIDRTIIEAYVSSPNPDRWASTLSAELGVAPGTLRVRKARIVSRLRRMLETEREE